jgi:DNA polymerase
VTAEARQKALDDIAAEVRVCTRCRLHQNRTNAVPGEGHPDTEVVFVGEGPGYNEDQQGRPFVGAAGGLLSDLLTSVGWDRREVFITNVVKCRPPGNRDPEPDEIAACRPYLERQLKMLDPALVVTLGRFSMTTFMPGARISSAHGTLRPVDPATGAQDALAFAMYHPAAAFRQNALKETLRSDMAEIPGALIRARELREDHRADATREAGDGAGGDAAGGADARHGGAGGGRDRPVEAAPVASPSPAVRQPAAVSLDVPPLDADTVPAVVWAPDADLWEGFDVAPGEARR